MSGTNNGAVAPNDETVTVVEDGAIDAAIDGHEPGDDDVAKLSRENAELKGRVQAQTDVLVRTQKQLDDVTSTSKMLGEQMTELLGHTRDARERGFAYAYDEIEARMERAVENADKDAFRAAKQDLNRLYQSRAPKEDDKSKQTKKDDQPKQTQTAADPTVTAWFNDNAWYHTDSEMRGLADGIYNGLLASEPHTTNTEKLAKVKARVAKRFPDKFPNAAREAPTAVSRPGPQGGRPKTKEPTLADLDDDAKAALAAIKRVDPNFKDENYLKGYKSREARQKEMNR